MSIPLSLYLDLVRLGAALIVFLLHTSLTGYMFGTEAIMAFFVLSGFVIAHTTQTSNPTLREYTLSRLARLYSVAIPALIGTVLLDHLGKQLSPATYHPAWYGDSQLILILRFAAHIFFLNQLWFLDLHTFSNLPYWTLGYEAWYYALFGAIWYLSGRTRLYAAGVIALIAGPKILLLLPVWALGVAVYWVQRKRPLSEPIGWLLVASSLLGMIAYFHFQVKPGLAWRTAHYLGEGFYLLQYSKDFVSNYVFGTLVAANVLGVATIANRLEWVLMRLARPIRAGAAFTFAIYLFHTPLLWFFLSLFKRTGGGGGRGSVAVMSCTLVACVALGMVTEQKKAVARRLLDHMFHWFDRASPQKPHPVKQEAA